MIWFLWRGALNSVELHEWVRSLDVSQVQIRQALILIQDMLTQQNSLFHWVKITWGLFFVCLCFLLKTCLSTWWSMCEAGDSAAWGAEEELPRRGGRGIWHKGSPNKSVPAACRVAIQISMLLCKSLAIIIILFQSILLQLSAMYVKYTCLCIYTQRYKLQSLNFFWRRCTKSRFPPYKNPSSHINYNRHF